MRSFQVSAPGYAEKQPHTSFRKVRPQIDHPRCCKTEQTVYGTKQSLGAPPEVRSGMASKGEYGPPSLGSRPVQTLFPPQPCGPSEHRVRWARYISAQNVPRASEMLWKKKQRNHIMAPVPDTGEGDGGREGCGVWDGRTQARPARTKPGRGLLYFLGDHNAQRTAATPGTKRTGMIYVFRGPSGAVKKKRKSKKVGRLHVVNATGSDPQSLPLPKHRPRGFG